MYFDYQSLQKQTYSLLKKKYNDTIEKNQNLPQESVQLILKLFQIMEQRYSQRFQSLIKVWKVDLERIFPLIQKYMINGKIPQDLLLMGIIFPVLQQNLKKTLYFKAIHFLSYRHFNEDI